MCNHYLNDLFGKDLNNDVKEPNLNKKNKKANSILNGNEDIFFTRPFYNPNEYRWGNKDALITDYVFKTNNQDYPNEIFNENVVCFYYSVKFLKDFNNVLPGIIIKTLDGLHTGSNSLISSQNKFLKLKGGIVFNLFETSI